MCMGLRLPSGMNEIPSGPDIMRVCVQARTEPGTCEEGNQDRQFHRRMDPKRRNNARYVGFLKILSLP